MRPEDAPPAFEGPKPTRPVAQIARRAVASRALLVGLLFLAALISYVDRGSLSIAAPILSKDMALSPVGTGLLLSAFFWSYAAMQIGAGWLTDRFPVRWVFAAGFLIWSIATLASGLAEGVVALFGCRLLLGVGESVLFPGFAKIITAAFPADRRALPNAVLDAGTKIGPAVAVLAGGLIVAHYGWRMMFFVTGGISLMWLVPWFVWGPREPPPTASAKPIPLSGPSLLDILRRREAWGVFIGASSYTYAYFFLLTWLPSYLVQQRRLSLNQMSIAGSLPYLLSAGAAILAGWLSDRAIRRGASATLVRKGVVVGALLMSTLALPSAIVTDLRLSFLLLCFAYVAFGVFASNHWAISQTLAGPAAAGKWAGLQNCLGAMSGVAAPIVTGFVIKLTHSFDASFALTAAFAVAGALSYLILVGPITPLDWAERRRGEPSHRSGTLFQKS